MDYSNRFGDAKSSLFDFYFFFIFVLFSRQNVLNQMPPRPWLWALTPQQLPQMLHTTLDHR